MKRVLLLIIITFFTTSLVIAQPIIGRILDSDNGESLVGATVTFKDDITKGTSSGLDGEIELKTIKYPTTLIVDYLGYVSQEIVVNSESDAEIIISLETDNLLLSGITVV